jgi:transcriptional regulator GlxA family with amidase domain
MPRTIAMLMFADGQALDVCGPMEVFALASRQALEDGAAEALYELRFVAMQRSAVTMASGLRLQPDQACDELAGAVDTLLVSGGMGDALDRVRADAPLLAWLRTMARRVRRIGSICNGALLLAEAGILDGREATTHWKDARELQQRYPGTHVIPDAIYSRDGEVWTSAGITAGMDLALAMVAADHGMPLALKVAKRMVMVCKRSGGQTQFSEQLSALDTPDDLAELATWLRANLRRRIDVESLAERVHLSTRHFRRLFLRAMGTTPRAYLEQLRVEAAKSLLENTAKPLKRVADECGFVTDEALRRAFVRQVGIAPGQYRERFGTQAR